MAKRLIKFLLYMLYLCGGSIIAFFLPEHSRFVLGFIFSMMCAWSWKTMNQKTIEEPCIGCQCSDRPGETTIFCCNMCGKPVEEFWTGKTKMEVHHE